MSMYSKFAVWYDQIFPFSQGVYAFLTHQLGSGGPVLDLGCGTGDYCAAFTRDGHEAVGVDLDAAMIAQGRARAPQTAFHVMDMTRFASLGRSWQMIYSIGNTAAHLPHEQFKKCIQDVHNHLLPDGIWIVQVMNWDFVLRRAEFMFPVKDMGSAVFHRSYKDISADFLTFHTALDISGERKFEDQVRLYPLRSQDIIAQHEAVGFQLVEHVADYAASAFDAEIFSANIFVFKK